MARKSHRQAIAGASEREAALTFGIVYEQCLTWSQAQSLKLCNVPRRQRSVPSYPAVRKRYEVAGTQSHTDYISFCVEVLALRIALVHYQQLSGDATDEFWHNIHAHILKGTGLVLCKDQ